MPVITFLPSYRKITVESGTTILDAARQAGFQMNVVCGGQGKCGKCIVFVKAGDVTFDREKFGRFFTGEELDAGGCLGCQTAVLGDLQVLIPESSLIQEQKILIEALGLETAFSPSVWKYALELQPPTLDDPSRISHGSSDGIQKKGGPVVEKIYAPLEVLHLIPRVLRESGWRVTGTVALVPGGYRLINVEKGDTTRNSMVRRWTWGPPPSWSTCDPSSTGRWWGSPRTTTGRSPAGRISSPG